MRGLANLVPLLLLGLLFYVLLIRPQRNRQRQAQQLLSQVSPGDQVVTTAGLYGTVAEVAGDSVSLEVSPGVRMRFVKGAISRIVAPEESDAAVLDAPADHEYDDERLAEDDSLARDEPTDGGYRPREPVAGSELAGSSYTTDQARRDGYDQR